MSVRVSTWIISGTLALAALTPAAAQSRSPLAAPIVRDYTGVVINGVMSPLGYRPAPMPTTWVVPQYVIHYAVEPRVYVPVIPARPPVEPVPTAAVTLRTGAAPADLGVSRGTVVTLTNAADRERTLVVYLVGPGTNGGRTEHTRRLLPVTGSVSLVFRESGTYEYSLLDDPERRGRIVVGG
jgi:hypothetical protein